MNSNTPRRAGVDRADAEAVLYRVAICTFTYYQGKEIDEPGYSVGEDVAWCIAALGSHADLADSLRPDIYEMITNPNADRRAFIIRLTALPDR